MAANSKLCLTVRGDGTANQTVLIQDVCTGRTAQNWTLRATSYADQYVIENAANGNCLDNAGPTKMEDGAAIMQWNCVSSAPQQRWRIAKTSSGTALVSVISGRCIAVEGAVAGAAVTQRTCVDAPQQAWNQSGGATSSTVATLQRGAPFPLVAASSKLCLTVKGDGTANQTVLVQEVCTGRTAQNWSLRPSGYADQYLIQNAANGSCLDNAGPTKMEDGAAIMQWNCVSSAPQHRWRIVKTSSGTALVSVISGRCIAVEGGSSGAAVTQRSCSDIAQQSWNQSGGATSDPATAFQTGTAFPLVAASSKFCLTVKGDGTANQTVLVQEVCTGRAAQNWTLRPSGYADQYVIANSGNGKCLDNAGPTKMEDGAAIMQWDCVPSATQHRWRIAKTSSGTALVSVISGRCIAVEGSSSGAAVTQRTCSDSAQQSWNQSGGATSDGQAASGLDLAGGTGSGQIKASHSGMCLSAPAGDATDGAAVKQQPCGSGSEQIWDAAAMNGGFKLTNRSNGKCLNLYGSRGDDWTPIVQYACGGASNEVWSGRAQNGGFALVSAATGKCADVSGASTAAGAALIQWPCHGGGNQTFTSPASTAAGTGGTGTGTDSGNGTSAGDPPGEVPLAGNVLLINRQSGMCVSIPGGQAAAGLQSKQTTCLGTASESWSFVSVGTGYQIKNLASGLCLFSDRGFTANGPSTVQQACNPSADGGRWQIRRLGQWFEIVGIQSGRCMSVTDGSRDDGATLSQWDCNSGDNQRFTIVSATFAPSAWTAPRSIGIVPVSVAPLPNGKLLMWAGDGKNSFGFGNTMWTTLYDPSNDSAVESNVTNAGQMFCPGTNVLPDGRILTNGGRNPGGTSIYDPATNAWSTSRAMNIPRGYNGNTTLSTGEALTYGGSWSGDPNSDKLGEVWSSSTGQWRVLSNVSSEPAAITAGTNTVLRDNHYWLFAARDGWAFNAGPSPKMFWIDTRGAGALTAVGTRGDDVWSQSGTASMYDVGRIIKMGGATAAGGAVANDNAYTIDITAGPGSAPQVTKLDAPPFPRTFQNSVVLPSGEVVTIGGQTMQNVFTDTRSIMIPDIWSPKTGKFSLLAPITVPRNYHSWAVLMPDGRVAAGGGGLCACDGDHYDFQFLSPPYLFDASGKPAARPTITSAPGSASAGSTIGVATDRTVASFVLVRLSSVTHSVNGDQRRVPLSIASSNGNSYQLALPSDRGALLPGPWMLFAMDAAGVPSVAKVVRIP